MDADGRDRATQDREQGAGEHSGPEAVHRRVADGRVDARAEPRGRRGERPRARGRDGCRLVAMERDPPQAVVECRPELARHHRPDGGDREQACHARDRVVDARCDPRMVLVDPCKNSRGERGDGDRQPDPEHDGPGQDVADVGDVAPEPDEPQQPEARDYRATGHEEPRPQPVGESAHPPREHEDDQSGRHERHAGRERPVPGDLLEVDGDEEHRSPERRVDQERRGVTHGEVAAPKQVEWKHRIRSAALV